METSAQFIKTTRKKTTKKIKLQEVTIQEPTPQSAAEQFESRLQNNKYLSNLVKNQRMKKVAMFLSSYRGSNLPIDYQSKYNFKEKWEAKHRQNDFQHFQMHQIEGRYFWFSLALMPFILIQIWFVSLFRIFQVENYHLVFIIGLLQEIISFLIQCYVFYEKADQKQAFAPQALNYFTKKEGILHICKIYSITYYLLIISNVTGISQNTMLSYFFFDAIIILLKYTKVQNTYGKIKFKAFSSKYKNYMHLFDLLSNIFIMLHCFAMILFLCTYCNPDNNWLTISPLNLEKNWINDYLTSIYFSSTTMLTVGYGDLRPTNGIQVLCIILVQLLGISFNAYAINEIGINLSQMRHQKQSLQRDLSNAQKLANSNKMSKGLKQKMYNQILKHQYTSQELEISEENSLMNRMNHQIKQQIQGENQIRIAKSCLFFICNFTKRFQIDLSKKLLKVLYQPNTTLVQTYGKERLYLITKGQVDVMTEKRYQGRNLVQKVLKTISNKDQNPTFLSQVYGVSAFFSGKPSRIKAVAKNFTTCYILQKGDVYESILEGEQDFQKYHYFKLKYHLSRIPEKYQTPQIQCRKQHYTPNIFYLIKKHQIEMVGSNSRKNLVRRNGRIKKVYEIVEDFDLKSSKQGQSLESEDLDKIRQSTGSKTKLKRISFEQDQIINCINKPRAVENRRKNLVKLAQLKQLRLQYKQTISPKQLSLQQSNKQYKKLLLSDKNSILAKQVLKQSHKQYKNYLPRGNLSNILNRFLKNELKHQKDSLLSILKQKKFRKTGLK